MLSKKAPTASTSFWLWRTLLLALVFSWLASALSQLREWSSTSEDTPRGSPPNILLIVADDLGYNDTSAINPGGIDTPNISRLAQDGVTFTRHYADATCTPSRVALLSGRYPERSGFRPVGAEIPAEFPTIAEALGAAGYRTYLTGKWHAGEERPQGWPQNKGFDQWFGFLNQFELSPAPGPEDAVMRRPTYINPLLRSNGAEPGTFEGHLTDILTEHTLQKIRDFQASETPWFIYHGFLAPHAPIQPAPRYRERFEKTPDGEYRALVTQLDDAVGRLLEAVDADNTLVVFISDNGGTNLQRDNNFPFFGKKNEVYEGAFRTLLAMQWPGQLPAGKVVDEVAMNVDVYPTLLAAAGVPQAPGIDGVNLMPTMLSDAPVPGRARGWETVSTNVNAINYSYLAAGGQLRLTNPEGITRQLYDLAASPSGDTDIAATHEAQTHLYEEAFWADLWQKSLVAVTSTTGDVEGQTLYSGFDTLRSPFRHGFAIGLEVGPLPAEQVESGSAIPLAGQEGLWKLHYLPGQGLQWSLGDNQLTDAHFDAHRCNAVILTGYLQPLGYLAVRAPRSPLKLFSDGFLRDIRPDLEGALPGGDTLSAPTWVNHGGRAVFANTMLSTFAEPYSPRVADQYAEFYERAYREHTLAMAQVSNMNSLLCQGE